MSRKRNQGGFEDLVEYLVERCLKAADNRDKNKFVESLIDFNDVVDSFLEQQATLGNQVSDTNRESLERIFSNYFVDLYEGLIEAPPTFRTEVISAITTSIRRSRDVGFSPTYQAFLSTLNRCYRLEMETGEFEFRAKRFFVRRYNLLIRKSVDQIQASDSPAAFETARSFWEVTFDQAQQLLKTAIEATDEETYSEIISKLTEIYYYDVVSSNRQRIADVGDSENEFLEKKAEFGQSIESQVSVLTFVLTGWAFRRFREGTLSEEEYKEIATTTESQRNSIAAVAEVYYDEIRGEGRFEYWEGWNLDEAMAETMGVATSAPAALSWLQAFYCTELLRLGSQSFEDGELDVRGLPIPVSKAVVAESDKIRKTLESLHTDSIVEIFIDSGTDIERLIDAIVQLHEDAEETYRNQVREDVHESALDDESVKSFEDSIQSDFVEGCTLRNVLRDIEVIAEDPSEEGGQPKELGRLQVPRRALVSVDDIPLHLSMQRYVSPIEDRYRELLFENLEVVQESVISQEELLERVREYVDSHDVEAILTTLGVSDDVFRDADAYKYVLTSEERVFENQRGSFAGTPVLSMRGDGFSILLVFAGPTQIIETNPADRPLSIDMIPAEETLSEEDRQNLSEEELENIKDWVYVDVSYLCQFTPGANIGVAITVER
ncbi:hypothetical protein NDI76_19645 [Halogeometricum sp. S1BR25-6]|uniref:Uncharacterized protein n=1 Tax=Halogeometricum salsisoli TaxID=2950536 RepID=A0ABU2GL08_9EURY|nr:hypothetical protein [Halogeometricum sp. S1BR25-6]MDS0300964.1 hypothetical protein [Halogeometricum sp. S1BR25-6]